MAAETENYGFPKPGEDDFYDIGVFNLAMDKADEAIKAAEEKADSHYGDSNVHITGEEREKWDSSLPKTGDSKDNTVTFNSGDAMSPTGWADVGLISSGEEHKGLWRKVSLIAKNMRYLWKMCGTNDISKLGDGTLTGAVSKLNTDLQAAKTEVAPGIACIKYRKTVIVNIDKEIDFHGGWNVIASLPYAAFGVTVMYGIFHTYGGDDAGIIRVYQKSLELEIQNFKEEKTIRARGAISYITEN